MAAIGRLAQVLQRLSAGSKGDRHDAGRPHTARRIDTRAITTEVERWQREIAEQCRSMADTEIVGPCDPLTGLFNRSYLTLLQAKLDEPRPTTGDSPMDICVLCIDLDHFRPVNDSLGQPAGDEVLRQVAARLRQAARQEQDVVLRLGGDEFLLLLPCPVGLGSGIAQSIAARIMTSLREPIVWLTTVELRLGASIGAAVWRPGRGPLSAVIAQADAALFAAKRAGRGRFRQYAAGSAEAKPRARMPLATTED